MQKVEASLTKHDSDYAFAVRIDFDLIKKKDDAAVKATVVKTDPDITVTVENDGVPSGYDWTYQELLKRLTARYSDFKQNAAFHGILKPLKADPKFCYERFLDPKKKSGTKKPYYNPNVLKEFDAHYTRKGPTLFEPDE